MMKKHRERKEWRRLACLCLYISNKPRGLGGLFISLQVLALVSMVLIEIAASKCNIARGRNSLMLSFSYTVRVDGIRKKLIDGRQPIHQSQKQNI
jgi:hypothetical protein